MRDGTYGWEQYRLKAAVRWANTTGQRVYYTIHDWELAGACSSDEKMRNNIDDWVYADVEVLCRDRTHTKLCKSYYNSESKDDVPIDFWAADEYFSPLRELWVPSKKTD